MNSRYSRGQWWLITLGVVSLGFAICMAYTTRIFQMSSALGHMRELAAGEAVVTDHGSMKVLSLQQSTSSQNPFKKLPDGAVSIVATMEAEVYDDEGAMCYLRLVDDSGRLWSYDGSVGDAVCPTDVTDKPAVFSFTYTVPQSAVEHLAGVAVPDGLGAGIILRPPAS